MHTLRVQQLIIVIFLFMLLNISFPASAADHERVRFQGKVMELSSKKENIMIVSERQLSGMKQQASIMIKVLPFQFETLGSKIRFTSMASMMGNQERL